MSRSISILGATGSIGRSTVDVIEQMRAGGADLRVEAVSAGRNLDGLADVCRRLQPRYAAVADTTLLGDARAALAGLEVEVGAGASAVAEAGARPADWLMAAIVGAAGIEPTMAAVRRGGTVALANKECLICAGGLMLDAAREAGTTLLPVDSEHNAIFQVLTHPTEVERLTLTASGGPFRTWTMEAMAQAGPKQAVAHPNWSMGAKISVDSATLMNKGLELIEASYLFGHPEDRIGVLIHPQSIIHSLVHYADGSVLAQLSAPDMRTPIAHTLAWPDRTGVSTNRLDLAAIGQLTFEEPDLRRFPALRLAREALRAGPGRVVALNGANEVAVEAFLAGRIRFLDISRVVEEAGLSLERSDPGLIAKPPSSLAEVWALDGAARDAALQIAGTLAAA